MNSNRQSSGIGLALVLLLAGLASGCEITRIYQGSQIRAVPDEFLKNGVTSKADVLRVFGPPDRIQRQLDGDVFTYLYLRKDSRKFTIEEPVLTNTKFLQYTRIDEKTDRLVVLFDKAGVVSAFGYRASTAEMPTGSAGMSPFNGPPEVPPPAPRPAVADRERAVEIRSAPAGSDGVPAAVPPAQPGVPPSGDRSSLEKPGDPGDASAVSATAAKLR